MVNMNEFPILNVAQIARITGIDRVKLYNKKKYNIVLTETEEARLEELFEDVSEIYHKFGMRE